MSDPATISAIIGGLVSTLSAYMTYRVGMKQAEQKSAPAPAKSAEAAKGEQIAPVIEVAIQQHGQPDEQTALAGYTQNPTMFEPILRQVIEQIASRNPSLAQQLATIAQETGISANGGQTATGSYIAQADRGSSASVNVNHPDKPKP